MKEATAGRSKIWLLFVMAILFPVGVAIAQAQPELTLLPLRVVDAVVRNWYQHIVVGLLTAILIKL